MKVVINKCFGGFGLSPRGIARWAELKGRSCYFFKHPEVPNYDFYSYVLINLEEAEKTFIWHAYDTPNPADFATSKDWHSLSEDERRRQNENSSKHSLYARDIPRDDAALIQVVEELGDDASGEYGELHIVEIPDNIIWEIDEYDGLESVVEKHRSWS